MPLNKAELKACMARKSMTQKKLSQKMGLTETTMCMKIKRGHFTLDELEQIAEILQIEHPWETLMTQKADRVGDGQP